MKKTSLMRAVLATSVLATISFNPLAATGGEGVERIYLNGHIVTLNQNNDTAQAVAIDDGMIVAVGANDDMRRLAGKHTETVDLAGKTMIPGIYDAHSHLAYNGMVKLYMVDLNSPPIGTVGTIADLKARLTVKAEATPAGEWIQGFGYDDTLMADKRHPTRADLDAVSTTHPISISHVSGHLVVANSLALQLAGISAKSQDPVGGVIQRDARGEPTGLLEETPATTLVQNLIPMPTAKEYKAAIRESAQVYIAQGVTTANEGASNVQMLSLFNEASAEAAGLPIQVMVWSNRFQMEEMDTYPLSGSNIRVGGIKEFGDGSIQGYTGYLSNHYHEIPDGYSEDYHGYPRHDRDTLADIIQNVHCSGRQILVHGNGDAAIDDILYGIGKAQDACPRENTRHTVVHAQMAREDQLDKMVELAVIPSFFVLHTYYWGDRHRDTFMGPERAARISPARSALDRGIPFTIHADTPVVPMEPMRLIWAAVNRVSTSGDVIGPEQRVSPLDALRATTINAAYQNFEENIKGSIEVGKQADLVVLSANPLTVHPMTIKDIQVEQTLVAGKVVYDR